jgi:GT2 family glycosyltransferase
VQTSNLGFAAANNIGAALTRGDSLLLLNPDAWLVGDCLSRLETALDGDPGLGLVAPRLEGPDGRPQPGWSPDRGVVGETVQKVLDVLERRPRLHGPAVRLARRLGGPGWYTAACVLIRRQAFAEVGGFDDRFFLYFEDTDLSIRLRAAGWRLASIEHATACHVRGAGAEDPDVRLAYRISQLYYYRKHRPPWEQWVIDRYLAFRLGEDWERVRRAVDGPRSGESEAM